MEKVTTFIKEWNKCLYKFKALLEEKSFEYPKEYKKILKFNLNGILSNNELLNIPNYQMADFDKYLVSNICSLYIKGEIENNEFVKNISILNKRFFGKDFDDGLSVIYILITRKEGNEHILKFSIEKLEVLVKDFCDYVSKNMGEVL